MEPHFYAEYNRHERTHWWFRWRFSLIRSLLDDLAGDCRPRVLDAGCGTGGMLQHLADCCDMVGIDVAPEAIACAAERGISGIIHGSLTSLPFADSTFDIVLVLDVLEHIEEDDLVLQNLLVVLRPGGHLILTVPAFQFLWSEHDEINHHKRRYTAGEIERLIERSGLTIRRVTYCDAVPFVPVLIRRTGMRLLRRLTGRRPRGQHSPRSDLRDYPRIVNEVLYRLLALETRLLRRVDLPIGVSILALADRPAEA